MKKSKNRFSADANPRGLTPFKSPMISAFVDCLFNFSHFLHEAPGTIRSYLGGKDQPVWNQRTGMHPDFMDRLDQEFLGISVRYRKTFQHLHCRDLIMASDYSGSIKGDSFYTISKLVVSIASARKWDRRRLKVRREHLHERGTLSYKELRDYKKRNALPHFLDAANSLKGLLVTFMIDESLCERFCNKHEAQEVINTIGFSTNWKPNTFIKAQILASLNTFLSGGLLGRRKNLVWVTDDDDFIGHAENVERILDLWGIVGETGKRNLTGGEGICQVIPVLMMHNKKRNMLYEDLCSIPDLAAGSLTEILGKSFKSNVPAPYTKAQIDLTSVPEKASKIFSWISKPSSNLKKIQIIISRSPESTGNIALAQVSIFSGDDLPIC